MPIKAKEKGHQRVRKTIKELCLMDDDFMTACKYQAWEIGT